jgi:hypothetical protein
MANMRKTLLSSAVILLLVTVTQVSVTAQKMPGEDPISFVSRFYEGYLNGQVFASVDQQKAYLTKTPFFSKSFQDLMARNSQLCQLSRGDDICGFGADGDIYLDTQEFGPQLNFKKSDFKAGLSAPDIVDVSFTVWPGEKKVYRREMRFKMVKEDGDWRVDDFGSKSDNGSFIFSREKIMKENAFLIDQARDLQMTWSWIQLYLTSSEKSYNERVLRFLSFPLELCDANGKCNSFQCKDNRLVDTIRGLHAQTCLREKDEEFGKKESVNPRDGDEVTKCALVFRFKQSAWWIVKVDFRMHGVSEQSPVQK